MFNLSDREPDMIQTGTITFGAMEKVIYGRPATEALAEFAAAQLAKGQQAAIGCFMFAGTKRRSCTDLKPRLVTLAFQRGSRTERHHRLGARPARLGRR